MTVLPAVTVRFSSAGCRPAWESARVSRAFSCWQSREDRRVSPSWWSMVYWMRVMTSAP